jgi:hypothetical protein
MAIKHSEFRIHDRHLPTGKLYHFTTMSQVEIVQFGALCTHESLCNGLQHQNRARKNASSNNFSKFTPQQMNYLMLLSDDGG